MKAIIRNNTGQMDSRDELDDSCSSRRDDSERMYMCHDIVSSFLFFFSRDFELLSVQVLQQDPSRICDQSWSDGRQTNQVVFHLLNGFVGDWKSKLPLGDGEVQPEFPPSMVPILLTCIGLFAPSGVDVW
jgi:hypothetical protein